MKLNERQAPLLARWEAFMGKIKGRHDEILTEAGAGLGALLKEDPTGHAPCMNAINAIKMRVIKLTEKIDQAWSDDVGGRFRDARSGQAMPDFDDVGIEKMEEVQHFLSERWERFRCGWEAHIFRTLWPHVKAAMDRPTSCSQCGARLSPEVCHRSVNVNCDSCGSLNTIIPDTIVGTYFSSGPHHFAQEAALERRLAIDRYRHEVDLERRYRGWPTESRASLEKWEAMEEGYWREYAAVRRQVNGESEDSAEAFVQSRIQAFRERHLAAEPNW